MSEVDPNLNPSTAPADVDLGARVEQVEHLLARLVKAFNGHRQVTGEELDRTTAMLAELQKMLAPTTDAPTAAAPTADGPSVVPWIERATAQQWHDLAAWVDWLIETYEFRAELQIYSCWPAHPGIVEELAALWDAWRDAAGRAVADGAPPGDNDALAFWHDRYLAPLVHRLHALYAFKECRYKHESSAPAPRTDHDLLPPLQ